jgi:hypothetical protein
LTRIRSALFAAANAPEAQRRRAKATVARLLLTLHLREENRAKPSSALADEQAGGPSFRHSPVESA